MAIKNILLMGDLKLRERSEEIDVDEIKSKKIQHLIQDLKDTAKLNPEDEGFITVGLSAPQIGSQKRIFVVLLDVENKKDPKFEVYINPKLDFVSTKVIQGVESCLSTPGLCGLVGRYDGIKVTFYDESGNKKKVKVSGEKSVFIQHEVDHLDGILWIDRVKDTKTISYC